MSRTWMALFVLALASLSPSPSLWAQERHFRSELYPTDMCPMSGYELHGCDQSMCLLACKPSGPVRKASDDVEVFCLSEHDPAYDELIYGDPSAYSEELSGRSAADGPDRCTDYDEQAGCLGLADRPCGSVAAERIRTEPKYWDGYGDYVQGFYPLDYYYDDRAEQADLDAAQPQQGADCYRWFDDSRYIDGYGGDDGQHHEYDQYEDQYGGQYEFGQYEYGQYGDGYDSGCYDQGHHYPGYGEPYSRGVDNDLEQDSGYEDFDNYDDDGNYDGYDGNYGGYDDGYDGGYDDGYDDDEDNVCGYDEYGQPYDDHGWTDDADVLQEPAGTSTLNKRQPAERKQWKRSSAHNDDGNYYGDSWDDYDQYSDCGDSPFNGPAAPPEAVDYWEEYADYGDLYPESPAGAASSPVVDDWDHYSACDIALSQPELTGSAAVDPLVVRWVQQALGAWNCSELLMNEVLGRGVQIQDAVFKVAAWWEGQSETAAWNCYRSGQDQWSR